MEINGFDWDDGNGEKCKKHGITIEEVESIFHDQPYVSSNMNHESEEIRYHAVGKTFTGRYAFVVFTFRNRPEGILIRPISARFMHQKEINHYEKQIKK